MGTDTYLDGGERIDPFDPIAQRYAQRVADRHAAQLLRDMDEADREREAQPLDRDEPVPGAVAHRYVGVVIDEADPYRSLACETCTQRGRRVGDLHTCDACDQPMAARDVNTSVVLDGWYHGWCLRSLVSPETERVALSDMRRFDLGHAVALQREAGDGDL